MAGCRLTVGDSLGNCYLEFVMIPSKKTVSASKLALTVFCLLMIKLNLNALIRFGKCVKNAVTVMIDQR